MKAACMNAVPNPNYEPTTNPFPEWVRCNWIGEVESLKDPCPHCLSHGRLAPVVEVDQMKLLVFEVDDKGNAISAPHPVPSAEELGQIMFDAAARHFAAHRAGSIEPQDRKQFIGNAIIECIRRKP